MLFFYYFIFLVLGLMFGSFVNAVVWRLRHNESFLFSRSHCVHCKKTLKAKDLFPLLSFLTLGGKCRYCLKPIPKEYFFVELSVGILFLIIFYTHRVFLTGGLPSKLDLLTILTLLVFTIFLSVIFLYDFKYQRILDKVTVPAMLIALGLNLIRGKDIKDLLLGASIIGGFFIIQYVTPLYGRRIFGEKVKIFRYNWIGDGDIRLGLLMGFMLGVKLGVTALFIAYLIGGFAGVYLLFYKKKKLNSQIPFGTFLSLATFIVLLWGEGILDWYFNGLILLFA